MSRNSGKDSVRSVLLLTTPKSYRTPAFLEAANRLGIRVVQAMDMPDTIARRWQSGFGIDFNREDEAVETILTYLADEPVDAVLAVDDSGSLIAVKVSRQLGLAHNHPDAALAARNKFHMRRLLAQSEVLSPRFLRVLPENDTDIVTRVKDEIGYPCVVKPETLNGSRGVIRADDDEELEVAVNRLQRLVGADEPFLIEGYIPGIEVALEGILDDGSLRVLALFDKPDPLEGPFFEETIYVTPSRLSQSVQREIYETTQTAARALGLSSGPIHAELRINGESAWIVEIAGRTIGGLCSQTLRFAADASLEELVLAQACDLPIPGPAGDDKAGGVMMIPIPAAGILRGITGLEEAKAVTGIESIQITAHLNYSLVPLPEGESYLGFIIARGGSAEEVEKRLRTAHNCLAFEIDPEITLLSGNPDSAIRPI